MTDLIDEMNAAAQEASALAKTLARRQHEALPPGDDDVFWAVGVALRLSVAASIAAGPVDFAAVRRARARRDAP